MTTTQRRPAFGRRLALVLAVGVCSVAGAAEDGLEVPAGEPPSIDGRIESGEWTAAPFEIGRAGTTLGQAWLQRSGGQLLVAFRGTVRPEGLGLRFQFHDAGKSKSVAAMVTPLQPPTAPLMLFSETEGEEPQRLDSDHCDLRIHFAGEEGFSFEMRLPLRLLGFRGKGEGCSFRAEIWDMWGQRQMASYPATVRGPIVGQARAALRPVGGWGDPTEPGELQPALVLLSEIEGGEPTAAGEPPPSLIVVSSGLPDGRRQEAPLVDLEARLRDAIERYPDYAVLRVHLVGVLRGRSEFERALAELDDLRKAFPPLAHEPGLFWARVELLAHLARYEDALSAVDEMGDRLGGKGLSAKLETVFNGLLSEWRVEQATREQERSRDDLPRVRLETGKGAIVLELFEDDAPNAVANFVSLVEAGFYDGTRFHWVAGGEQVFGGDPNSRDDDDANDGYGDPGYLIETEPSRRQRFAYTVTFADKRDRRRSEGSTFGIHIAPLTDRDGYNSVIGRVLEGREVVRRLEYRDTIEKAVVVRKRDHAYEVVKRPRDQ